MGHYAPGTPDAWGLDSHFRSVRSYQNLDMVIFVLHQFFEARLYDVVKVDAGGNHGLETREFACCC